MDTKNIHQKMVADSWQRCRNFGLNPEAQPEFNQSAKADIGLLLEAHRTLIQTTEHAVVPYYDNILNNSPCLILLTDSRGQILNSWGEKRFLSVNDKEWFAQGSSWQEASHGTNAIGTALTTGEAVQIERDEHFLKRHRYMIGSAAPIFDANNELLGVLDISSDAYMPQAHTLGMVRLMSQSIENRLIIDKYSENNYLITLNTHFDNLESQWSGLVVVNLDGKVIAFNRRAEYLLSYQLLGLGVKELFGLDLKALQDQAKKSSFPLRVLNKYSMHGKVQAPVNSPLFSSAIQFPFVNNEATKSIDITFEQFEFGDKKIKRAIAQANKVVEKDIPILVYGETGVGKEVFVKALHHESSRSDFPLMALNCAAMPADLVESELFGYAKGAFTGADNKGYVGLIRKADKGILFLDELGDMPLNVQSRLLRVLQERKVTPLGSTKSYPVDIKLISATNCHLKTLVAKGTFRKDLFYRVNGLTIELPTLYEREDKAALFEHIVSKKAQNLQQAELPKKIMHLFLHHPWPGNVRQFISVIDVAFAIADGDVLEEWHLVNDFFDDLLENENVTEQLIEHDTVSSFEHPPTMPKSPFDAVLTNVYQEVVPAQEEIVEISRSIEKDAPHANSSGEGFSIDNNVQENQLERILQDTLDAYKQCQSNKSKTAKLLNISRNTLYKRLRQLGLK